MGKPSPEEVERNAEIVALYESTAHLPYQDPNRWGYGRVAKRFGNPSRPLSRARIEQIVRRARKRKKTADAKAKPSTAGSP